MGRFFRRQILIDALLNLVFAVWVVYFVTTGNLLPFDLGGSDQASAYHKSRPAASQPARQYPEAPSPFEDNRF